jgi:hypothetical protein
MKMGPDTLRTADNESGRAKRENGTRCPRYRQKRVRARKTQKRDPTPSVPPKTSPCAQNMKTEPDALGTAENESGRAYKKTGADVPDTAKNESGSTKREKGT